MIEEQAQVVEVKGDFLVLQAQVQSSCGSCAASRGCGTSLLSKVIGRKFTYFKAENNINANIGDMVVVGIAEDALLKGSVMMYVIPVLSMLVFALLADYFLAVETYRDLLIAAFSVMGLLSGSFLSKWYFNRQSSIQRFAPVVLRKIIDHGKL